MILILWAGLASRSSKPWPGKGGCRKFPERLLSENQHQEGASRERKCQTSLSVNREWLAKTRFLPCLKGALFLTCKKKFWFSHIHKEAPPTKHPPHSTRQQSNSGQVWPALPGPPKTTTSHCGQVRQCWTAPMFGAVSLQEMGLCSEGRCAQGKPHCSSAPALRNNWPQREYPCWSGMFNIKLRGN